MRPSCPYCNGARTRRSHRSPVERILSLLSRWPYRCLECGGRFFLNYNAASGPRQPACPSLQELPASASLHALATSLQAAQPAPAAAADARTSATSDATPAQAAGPREIALSATRPAHSRAGNIARIEKSME